MNSISQSSFKQAFLYTGKALDPVMKSGGVALTNWVTGMPPGDVKLAATTIKDTGIFAKVTLAEICYNDALRKPLAIFGKFCDVGLKSWAISKASMHTGLTPYDMKIKSQTINYCLEGMKIHTNNFLKGLKHKKAPSK